MTYHLAIGPWQVLIIILISTFLVLLPLISLIDIVRNDFKGNDKLLWALIVIFLNIIGSVLYFGIGRSNRIKN
ncbi:MAG: PLDc N-terminal domain-containing protein [Muriicola sp.]